MEEKRGKKEGKKQGKKKTDDYSGHYVIASSRPPERQPLEHHQFESCQKWSKAIKGVKSNRKMNEGFNT